MKNDDACKNYNVEEHGREERLDMFLSKHKLISRSGAQKIIQDEKIRVNGLVVKKNGYILKMGDTVQEYFMSPNADTIINIVKFNTQQYNISILKEEKDYLIVNKPAGLLVHQTQKKELNTLTHQLLLKYPELKRIGEDQDRPGIVHRLDKEASGVMVIARSQKMFLHLKEQFKNREIEKFYKVLVYGKIPAEHGLLDFPIDKGKDGKMVSRPKIKNINLKNVNTIQPGKTAITEYFVEKKLGRFTLLNIKIYTGRTHQIRVHMFAFNHPVVGDKLYFNKKLQKKNEPELNRIFLHAEKICFKNLQDEKICYESQLAEELKVFLDKIS